MSYTSCCAGTWIQVRIWISDVLNHLIMPRTTKPEDRELFRRLIEASNLPIAIFAEWVLGADSGTAFRYLKDGQIPASRMNWLRRILSVTHSGDEIQIVLRWHYANRRWWPWVEHGNKRTFMIEERGLAKNRDYADVRGDSAAASVSSNASRSRISDSEKAEELANLGKVAEAVSARWEITPAGRAAIEDAELENDWNTASTESETRAEAWTARFARVAAPHADDCEDDD